MVRVTPSVNERTRGVGYIVAPQHILQRPVQQLTADGGQGHRVDAALREMLVGPMQPRILRPCRGILVRQFG